MYEYIIKKLVINYNIIVERSTMSLMVKSLVFDWKEEMKI